MRHFAAQLSGRMVALHYTMIHIIPIRLLLPLLVGPFDLTSYAAADARQKGHDEYLTHAHSPLFRPGSGAAGSPPRLPQATTFELSTSLPAPSLAPMQLQAATAVEDRETVNGDPGFQLQTTTVGNRGTVNGDPDSHHPLATPARFCAAVTAVFAVTLLSAIAAMYHRPGGDGHRPHALGFNGVQPNHIHKQPPYWDPSFDHKYSFRRYMTDMQHWVLLTDLPPHQQATLVLMNLGGAAYQLIAAMPPTELYAGATVNGVALDPVSNILLKLHHRFAQKTSSRA